jgi:hypothetical protein
MYLELMNLDEVAPRAELRDILGIVKQELQQRAESNSQLSSGCA